ncbi:MULTISPECIES: hypothetical protein [unclassified Paenibacillus]|uniref:hypothetical protein n=1 Tax=unclassified Paenibacillus TaxID=185978 RepID=UPI0008D0028A|nr:MULTISPECIES: hypothetical protein [unclassified Paenibacillus]QLG39960.1 hypothetical protein HW560_18855 [Paenibacillus sp. E222]SEN91037.1 hypothetical protein SAMN05518670_3035 [Paenibacillus sp. OK076]
MKKPIQKKWWFWLIVVIIVAGIFGNKDEENSKKDEVASTEVSIPTESKSETIVTEKSVAKTQEVKVAKENVKKQDQKELEIPGSLNMTPEEFRKSFNKRAQEIGNSKLKIGKKLEIQKGAVQDVFQYIITDYIGITGSINKADGSVRDVTMIGQGNGTMTSGADIVLAIGLVILSVNPDVPASSVANILSDMHILDEGVDWSTVDESTEVNGIRYTVLGSETIGIMFSASDANDK